MDEHLDLSSDQVGLSDLGAFSNAMVDGNMALAKV